MKFLDGEFGWYPRPWRADNFVGLPDNDNGVAIEPWTGEPRLTVGHWFAGIVRCSRKREHSWGSWRSVVGTQVGTSQDYSYTASRHCMCCNARQRETRWVKK